jgi:hypothetical protein
MRRKLASFAATAGAASCVDAYTPGERRHNPPQDEGTFRDLLVSMRT